MSASKILRIQRPDSPDAPILVKASSSGKHALDLDLLGTDGSSPFVGKVRQRKLKDLRSKSYQGDQEEWETILKHVLGVENTPASVTATNDLQIIGELQGEDPKQTINIILRKSIQQITQRLGSIELHQDDEAEVQLFDWTAQAVQDAEHQRAEVARLTASLASAESTIATLQGKLEELAKLKSEQDNQLFSQFAALLNEKKAKIRNQQRIISSAKIDPAKLRRLQQSLPKGDQKSSDSRKGKRKATTTAADSSEEDAFDFMDLDQDEGNGGGRSRGDFQADTESDRASTPESEIEEDEPSESDQSATKLASQAQPAGRRSRGQEKMPNDNAQESLAQGKQKVSSTPPPKRNLPFTRRTDAKSHQDQEEPQLLQQQQIQTRSSTQAEKDEDEETASDDDDEL